MTVLSPADIAGGMRARAHVRARRYAVQILLVVLINVPTISFGLALGWVSLVSGGAEDVNASEAVAGAVTTFLSSMLSVPVWARALAAGRRPALIATSVAFIICWSLKLTGDGWWTLSGRAAAGVGGAGAWAVAPLLASEMCEERFRGAAVSALVPASNLGLLLMYIAADQGIPHRTVLWCCLTLSCVHCLVFMFMPESPAYLSANGNSQKARESLLWLRGVSADAEQDIASWLQDELKALPSPEPALHSPFALIKDFMSDCCRRRTLVMCLVCVVGQEMCGVTSLLQYAERVFLLASDTRAQQRRRTAAPAAARLALLLGAVQLPVSILALYLIEKVGRRPLLLVTSLLTSLCLCAGAVCAGLCEGRWVGLWLAGAVAADSAGLQPVPYALLSDAFDYQWRGCAVLLVSAAGSLGNAAEAAVFPAVCWLCGSVTAAVALAAVLTACYGAWAWAAVPEPRGVDAAALQSQLCPLHPAGNTDTV